MAYGSETWKIHIYKIQVNNLLIFDKIISKKVLHYCLATNTGEWRIRNDMELYWYLRIMNEIKYILGLV